MTARDIRRGDVIFKPTTCMQPVHVVRVWGIGSLTLADIAFASGDPVAYPLTLSNDFRDYTLSPDIRWIERDGVVIYGSKE